ncbi:MAG: integration host factor subunit alpha [Bdellovibrionota bacterium]
MAYTKASMIDAICEKIGLPKASLQMWLSSFEMMKETLERGDNLKISGFGSFLIRDKRSRMGRNPQTGESMEITARRVITFKPSQILRDALNED